MTTIEKSSVIVELYDLPITQRKDDRYGRVVTTRSLTEDDLIAIAVSQRTDLSPTSHKSSMNILQEIAIEQIANGASVSFGLGYFNLGVNGVFVGNDARPGGTVQYTACRYVSHQQPNYATPSKQARSMCAAWQLRVQLSIR